MITVQMLSQYPMFSTFSTDELTVLSEMIEMMTYQPHNYLIHQDDPGRFLFFIVEGDVELLQKTSHHSEDYRLTKLTAGQIVGEHVLYGDSPYPQSVKTSKPTVALRLSQESLEKLAHKPKLYSQLLRTINLSMNQRLETENKTVISLLRDELKASHEQIMTGYFTILLVSLLTVFAFVLKGITDLYHELGTATTITNTSMIILLLIFGVAVKKSKYPLSFFGLTWNHGWKAFFQGIILSLPLLAIMVFAKWLIIHFQPSFSHMSLFSFGSNVSHHALKKSALEWTAFSYIFISSPAQEIIFRGGLQSCLQHFLRIKHHNAIAILLTSCMFGMIHLIFSDTLALLACALGLFWGWIYRYQKNVIGVITSHMLIGTFSFFILGIQAFVMPAQ